MIASCEPSDMADPVLMNAAKEIAGHTCVKDAGATCKDVHEEPPMHPGKLESFVNGVTTNYGRSLGSLGMRWSATF
jgi:hypothetical protein